MTDNQGSRWATYFKVIGTILLFVSWIVQNRLQNEMTTKKQYFFETRVIVSIEESKANQWEIARRQAEKQSPEDRNFLSLTEFKLISHLANAYSTAKFRNNLNDSESRQAIWREYRGYQDSARHFHQTNKYKELTTLRKSVEEKVEAECVGLIQEHERQYSVVVSQEETWATVFCWCYIVGSLAIACGFVIAKNEKPSSMSLKQSQGKQSPGKRLKSSKS